jgi:hypothetical protein
MLKVRHNVRHDVKILLFHLTTNFDFKAVSHQTSFEEFTSTSFRVNISSISVLTLNDRISNQHFVSRDWLKIFI